MEKTQTQTITLEMVNEKIVITDRTLILEL